MTDRDALRDALAEALELTDDTTGFTPLYYEQWAVDILAHPAVVAALAGSGSEARLREAQTILTKWAGSVDRLIDAAPIRDVVEEVGLAETGHSTPPERQAIRREAHRVVDGWLIRDLATLDALAATPTASPTDPPHPKDHVGLCAVPSCPKYHGAASPTATGERE